MGEKIPNFTAASVVGDNKGKEIDPIALAGDNPQILFFQDESGVAIRGRFGVVVAINKIDQKTDKDLHISCELLVSPSRRADARGYLLSSLRDYQTAQLQNWRSTTIFPGRKSWRLRFTSRGGWIDVPAHPEASLPHSRSIAEAIAAWTWTSGQPDGH